MDVVQDDLPICTYLYPYDSLRGMDMCGRDVVRSESHSFSSSRRKHICRSRRSQRARGLRGSVSQFVDLWSKFVDRLTLFDLRSFVSDGIGMVWDGFWNPGRFWVQALQSHQSLFLIFF